MKSTIILLVLIVLCTYYIDQAHSKSARRCRRICQDHRRAPVCGVSGNKKVRRIFQNQCRLRQYNCRHKLKFDVKHMFWCRPPTRYPRRPSRIPTRRRRPPPAITKPPTANAPPTTKAPLTTKSPPTTEVSSTTKPPPKLSTTAYNQPDTKLPSITLPIPQPPKAPFIPRPGRYKEN